MLLLDQLIKIVALLKFTYDNATYICDCELHSFYFTLLFWLIKLYWQNQAALVDFVVSSTDSIQDTMTSQGSC